MFSSLNKVKLFSLELLLGWVAKFEYPSPNNCFFFPFSPSFSKAILRTAELPSLCNVVSSIYQFFVPHFAITVFICIYWHYRIMRQSIPAVPMPPPSPKG